MVGTTCFDNSNDRDYCEGSRGRLMTSQLTHGISDEPPPTAYLIRYLSIARETEIWPLYNSFLGQFRTRRCFGHQK